MKRILLVLAILGTLLVSAQNPFAPGGLIVKRRVVAAGGGCDSINDASLQAYWRLSEATGTTREDTKNANDLSDLNLNVDQGAGLIDNCAVYTDNSQVLAIDSNAEVSWTGAASIDGYVKFSRSGVIIGMANKGGGAEYGIYRSNNDKLEAFIFDSVSGYSFCRTSTALTEDVWYYWCLYYDVGDGKAHIFVAGGTYGAGETADGDNPLANGPKSAGGLVRVGVDSGNGLNWGASLCDISLSHKTYSSGELTARANVVAGVVTGCRPTGL